jgi:hypothetical protein
MPLIAGIIFPVTKNHKSEVHSIEVANGCTERDFRLVPEFRDICKKESIEERTKRYF